MSTRYKIKEVAKIVGVDDGMVFKFVSQHWIEPADPQEPQFDEEDVARIRLILDLVRDLGVNDESVPIILHLIDQIHFMRQEMKKQIFFNEP